MNKVFLDLKKGMALYQVWLYQAYHELSAKYRRTVLGSVWIAGGMITTSLCLSLVFGQIMGQNLREVLPYIMAGILTFSLISFILTEGSEVFLGSSGQIKNHAYPFTYFVFEKLSKELMLFGHNAIVYFIAMAITGALVVPHWTFFVGLPIVLITSFCWATVMGMLAARYRDLRFMLPYVNQLIFFITPIFWKVNTAQGHSLLTTANPFYGLLEIIRSPLMGKAPEPLCWGLALGAMISGIIVWFIAFSLFRRRIPFWV